MKGSGFAAGPQIDGSGVDEDGAGGGAGRCCSTEGAAGVGGGGAGSLTAEDVGGAAGGVVVSAGAVCDGGSDGGGAEGSGAALETVVAPTGLVCACTVGAMTKATMDTSKATPNVRMSSMLTRGNLGVNRKSPTPSASAASAAANTAFTQMHGQGGASGHRRRNVQRG